MAILWCDILSALLITVCSSLSINTKNDQFIITLENKALLQEPGLSKVLDVLANDTTESSTKKSCLLDFASSLHQCPFNASVKFFENAEQAGLNHRYRNSMAVRPLCLFDLDIQGNAEFNQSRDSMTLAGEFCMTEHMPAAVAVGDYNKDGLVDMYFTVFHGQSVLYKNNGHGKYVDVTAETGIGPREYASGAVWLDVDMDGDLDLYVTSIGNPRHYLYMNQGGIKFVEEAVERGVSCELPNSRKLGGMSPSVGDYDMDGYPDIYITEWMLIPDDQPSASRLFHNRGQNKPGYFEDMTIEAGIDISSLQTNVPLKGIFTFASSFTDFDSDGCPDLAVTADYGGSQLYWNNCNGTFTRCTNRCGLRTKVDAMGHAIGDINGDGHLDWFSTGIHSGDRSTCQMTGCMFGTTGNALFINLNSNIPGKRAFSNFAKKIGVENGNWGWGAAMLDFNNDKYTDLVMTNGFDMPSTGIDDRFMYNPMKLWKNSRPGLLSSFNDVASESGLTARGQGRGLVKVDYDGDGDEDIVVAQNTGPPLLYENQCGNKNDWIKVQAKEKCPQAKKLCDSLHARITVTTEDGWKQTQEIGSSTHFMGQSEITAHFGLGSTRNDNVNVIVHWPRFRVTVYYLYVNKNVILRAIAPVDRPLQTPKFIKKNMTSRMLSYCPDLHITDAFMRGNSVGSLSVIDNGKKVLWHSAESLEKHGVYTLIEPLILKFSYSVKSRSSNGKWKQSREQGVLIITDVNNALTSSDVENFEACDETRHEKMVQWNLTEICQNSTVRRFDGYCNHLDSDKLAWGGANRPVRRDVSPAYLDGINVPPDQCGYRNEDSIIKVVDKCQYEREYGGRGSQRPSPRLISNELFHQVSSVPSRCGVNDMLTQWGQFITHDIDHTSKLPDFLLFKSSYALLPISVPKGDIQFDLDDKGDQYLPFQRSTFDRCSGQTSGSARQQLNSISSVIDGSVVYGSSRHTVALLRTYKNGTLKTGNGDNLPYNTFGVSNDNNIGRDPQKLLAAGDVRANVQPGIIALHTIFLREHNRWCEEYLTNYSMASDEEIFQYARRMVTAELQAITFREFLPVVLGYSLKPYSGYDEDTNPDVGHVFSVAAFRFGHSQVNTHLWRLNADGSVSCYGHLPLRDAYFKPERVLREGGIDPFLRGFVAQTAQEVDLLMVDDMRNFLFPVGASNGGDLAALDIQRGRDHGLPDYNTVRQQLGLKPMESFEEITENPHVACKLRELYGSVNNIDLMVGGLAERHIRRGEVGETFARIIEVTFLRIRRGDRFWYENIMTPADVELINSMSFSEIIRKNSGFLDAPEDIFFHWPRNGGTYLHCSVCHSDG